MTTTRTTSTTATRELYVGAYRRIRALEERMSARLRERILVAEFGGCGCRLHNCLVAWETRPYSEGPDHRRLAKLAKFYNHEQRRIWDTCGKLADSFARKF